MALTFTLVLTTSAGAKTTATPTSARWERVSARSHPSARDSAASAYDAATGQLVVFGGETGGGLALSDTWVWSESSWHEVTSRTHPPAVAGAAMAYDPKVHAVVLFGGEGQYGKLFSQTWLWSSSGWHLQQTASRPSGRAYPAMTYDTRTETVDLFGGFVGGSRQTSAQLWAWSARGWRQLTQHGLPALAEASMVYDPVAGELLLQGGVASDGIRTVGQTWVKDGTSSTWSSLGTGGPGDRAAAASVYDPSLGGIVAFGGWLNYEADARGTWLWANSHWSKIATSVAPPERSVAVMAFDDRDNAVILFGGASTDLNPMSDQWELR